VTPTGAGFKVEFAEESPMLARSVIVATGLLPYAHLPSELSGLPTDLLTHSAEHARLDNFQGRRVAVIGGGQSSLQTAALLNENGADVQIIVRKNSILWEEQIAPEIGLIDRILRPPTYLCEGWACVFYGSPDAFRLMPEGFRVNKTRTTFAPSGAWWLRKRVEGVIDMVMGHKPTSVEAHGSGVRVNLDGPKHKSIEADHVIAGTGFRIDVASLPFLSDEIKGAVKTCANFPVVNRAGESAVPGLYFAGAHTMTSLGPGVRFIAGTFHTSAQLARSVERRGKKGADLTEPTAPLEPLATESASSPAA
jgi:thioredoxin reductase